MPEDQGVNGDLWNDEAAILLKQLGWKQVGSSNIDIYNEVGVKHGIDRMFVFPDVRRNSSIDQGVFVEAKCYKTTSFSRGALQKWITDLDKKLTKTKNSERFQNTYPTLSRTILSNGLIVIWFSDIESYLSYRQTFREIMMDINIPTRTSTTTSNKIYVIDNFEILKLCSLTNIKQKFDSSDLKKFNFYYPSSDNFNNAVDRNEVLTLDYMFSKFVLAEAIINNEESKIVFYFGELTYNSFERLKSVLKSYLFLDKNKPLTIYRYKRDSEFRKILPDVKRLFEDIGIQLKMEEMESYLELPTYLRIN